MSHAIDQARERYGIELSDREINRASKAIHRHWPCAVRLTRHGKRGTLCAVRMRRQWVALIWIDGMIATVVPRKELAPYLPILAHRLRQIQASSVA